MLGLLGVCWGYSNSKPKVCEGWRYITVTPRYVRVSLGVLHAGGTLGLLGGML